MSAARRPHWPRSPRAGERWISGRPRPDRTASGTGSAPVTGLRPASIASTKRWRSMKPSVVDVFLELAVIGRDFVVPVVVERAAKAADDADRCRAGTSRRGGRRRASCARVDEAEGAVGDDRAMSAAGQVAAPRRAGDRAGSVLAARSEDRVGQRRPVGRVEERVVERGRARGSRTCRPVPWMNDGPALLPSALTRFHLASTNSSNAVAELVVGEQVEVVALQERQDRQRCLPSRPVWPLPPMMPPMMPAPKRVPVCGISRPSGGEDEGAVVGRAGDVRAAVVGGDAVAASAGAARTCAA